MQSTTESRELAIGLINENTEKFPYKDRKYIAQLDTRGAAPVNWVRLTTAYARWYERQYSANMFSTLDILLASCEVAEHYLED